MPTEKLLIFDEAGNAKRVKARLTRFLENEPVTSTEKAAIRSTLSVPASAEGLTPANNLSDVSNAATSRTNLGVSSADEDAEANGTKLLGPSVYFDGSNDVVTVADDSRFTFSDGVDDLPFTVSAFVKLNDATNCGIVSKYGSGSSTREWLLYCSGSDLLGIVLADSGGNTAAVLTTATMTSYEGQWIHVAAAYNGSGPNSNNAFSAAADSGNLELYINGVLQTGVTRSATSFAGMSNTAQAVNLGRFNSSTYGDLEIRNAQIFNRELTAAEVADLAKGNELGFADEWAGAFAGLGTIDETSGLASWSGVGSIVPQNLTETVNTTVGGRANVLKQEATTSTTGNTRFYITSIATAGTRVRVEFDYYIPSTNTTVDRIGLLFTGGSTLFQATTLDAWTRASVEAIVYSGSNTLQVLLWDGGTNNSTIGDYIGLDNFSITQIGTLADFRSERFDASTGKWYDLSDNAFIGTNSGATLVGREVPVYETGTWSGVYTPSTGSFTTMTMDTDLVYTRIGNVCSVTGVVQSDDVDATGASGSLRIDGLPFAASKVSACQVGYAWAWGVNYPISGAISGTSIYLYKRTSSTARTDDIAVTDLTTGSTNNRNVLYISATYKIQ